MISWSAKTVKFAFIMLALALSLAILAVACGGDDDDTGGDKTAAPADGGGGALDIVMGDNFFELDGEKNPTLELDAGAEVTINLDNKGTAIHAMRFAGEDNEYNSDDDAVSDPDIVSAGQKATLEFTAPGKAGTYNYQCDFHPTDMLGKITVK